MQMLAQRPRVVHGVQSPTGGVVPSVVFGLSVSNREFTSWESDGSTIQGEYEVEVMNNGFIPSPAVISAVTVESNEEDLTIIDETSPDVESKVIAPNDSVRFTIPFGVNAGSGSITARRGCNGDVSCETSETVAVRILASTYSSDGSINVTSTNCNIGGVEQPVEEPIGQPITGPEIPGEEEEPEPEPGPQPQPEPGPEPQPEPEPEPEPGPEPDPGGPGEPPEETDIMPNRGTIRGRIIEGVPDRIEPGSQFVVELINQDNTGYNFDIEAILVGNGDREGISRLTARFVDATDSEIYEFTISEAELEGISSGDYNLEILAERTFEGGSAIIARTPVTVFNDGNQTAQSGFRSMSEVAPGQKNERQR